MALPLPRVVPDVGPGGGLVTAMGGINSLANNMNLRRINKAKADLAPLTENANAMSKLAYANLMGPQFMAKLMGNDSALANMSEPQKQAALDMVRRAGMGQGTGNAMMNMGAQLQGGGGGGGGGNPFAQMMQTQQGLGQRMGDKFSNFLTNKLQGIFSGAGQQAQNPLAQAMQQQGVGQQQQIPQAKSNVPRPKDGVMLEGEQWYNNKGEPVYAEEVEEVQEPGQPPIEMELTEGQRAQPKKTYAENTGDFKGTVEQGKQQGKYRADALNQIGQSQLGLSHSGAVLDRMTDIVKNPVFWNARNTIPFFQDKQLSFLQKTGSPEMQELIGDFLSTGESFIASTVQGFGGRPLVREFDLAKRQKITPSDTVSTALGKLRSASSLHDIAEKKNQIVSDLLQQGINESDAIKQANKMVDVRAIEKETNSRLQRKIEIKNNKTGEKKMVTVEEARKLGVPNV